MQFRYASSTPDNIIQRNGGSAIYPTHTKISILIDQFMYQFSVSVILIENTLYLIKLLPFNTSVELILLSFSPQHMQWLQYHDLLFLS